MFAKIERVSRYSIDSVVRGEFTSQSINEIKLLTSYFISNDPSIRSCFYKILTKGKESEKEEQGTLNLLKLMYQILTKWDFIIHRIKEGVNQYQKYITSDRPVYLDSIQFSLLSYVSPKIHVWQTMQEIAQEITDIEVANKLKKQAHHELMEEIKNIQRSKNKLICQRIFTENIDKIEPISVFLVSEDMMITLPLNPYTVIHFYQNEKQKELINNQKLIVQKSNMLQLNNCEKYVISHSEDILKELKKIQTN